MVSGFVFRVGAQDVRPVDPKLAGAQWPAQWIAPQEADTFPTVFYARRDIQLGPVPAHYWVHVSADNRFVLHVNGQYAAEGPARGDLFHWRFETVDLAPLLHAGDNVIAAVVWNFGEDAPVAQMSNRIGFLMQGDTDAEAVVNTGDNWLVRWEAGAGRLVTVARTVTTQRVRRSASTGECWTGTGTVGMMRAQVGANRASLGGAQRAKRRMRTTTGNWCRMSCRRWSIG